MPAPRSENCRIDEKTGVLRDKKEKSSYEEESGKEIKINWIKHISA
jgi:hypothetical protein